MVWVLLALVAVAVVAVTLAAAAGRLHLDPMSEPVRSTPATGLPPRPAAADLDAVRFDTALRGYRMDQVDEVLTTLRATLADQERRLAECEQPRADQERRLDEHEQPRAEHEQPWPEHEQPPAQQERRPEAPLEPVAPRPSAAPHPTLEP